MFFKNVLNILLIMFILGIKIVKNIIVVDVLVLILKILGEVNGFLVNVCIKVLVIVKLVLINVVINKWGRWIVWIIDCFFDLLKFSIVCLIVLKEICIELMEIDKNIEISKRIIIVRKVVIIWSGDLFFLDKLWIVFIVECVFFYLKVY